jgi:osmotically-inducible protein OsmY
VSRSLTCSRLVSLFERGTADDVAASVRGVRDVNNDLTLDNADARLTYDPYVDAWSIYEYDWYTPKPITVWKQDSVIAEEIEQELAWSPFVDADEISVAVNNGVATLTGAVDSVAERQAAVENAFEGGAAGVRNQIEIEG